MSSHRVFRFAHAGVLVALLHALTSAETGEFDAYVWISLAIALPTTVFRGLIAEHPNEDLYKASDGFALYLSAIGTVAAFAFTFANYNGISAVTFAACSAGCLLLMIFGKKRLA